MSIVHVEREKTEGGEDQYTVKETPMAPAWAPSANLSVVGKPIPRVEGDLKVTGRAEYAYDVRLSGQIYAKVLRSPHPHARITRIDTSKAEALPGVRAVLSHASTPDVSWFQDTHLFEETVRFIGEEVAAVAADSEEIAEDALRLIEVEYEVLPFVMDPEAALKPDAPKLHKDGNLAGEPVEYERGDVAGSLGQADVVIEQTYVTQAALHNCLEPHGCTATWEGNRLTIWDSTQSIFDVRDEVATRLGLPKHHVRIIKQFMGGGFGSKQIAWKHTGTAVALEAGRAPSPANAGSRGREPGLWQPQPNTPAGPPRREARRHARLHRVRRDHGGRRVHGRRRSVGRRWCLPDALPLSERQDSPDGRLHQLRARRGVPGARLRRGGVRA